ncbi:MAG: hypothetical protein F6K14_30350 [Symploca sp. SIO2C1]|nr:hypothetical protein [Symploca sp. SIO2C1]
MTNDAPQQLTLIVPTYLLNRDKKDKGDKKVCHSTSLVQEGSKAGSSKAGGKKTCKVSFLTLSN